ncbi:thymidine phosphorylase [Candidatus Falkowbacteria bacterium]|jgi:AMP phosphorylase|nr:thymidine phosphorylase [Candidatus Falkowbacteria bacterium]MBT5503271.1 thymidine phosphorylase [Candidatus Falkowbacteria bacterium]MBT6574270.1 thymidine phosphorylase [Candidatus Falkowbacteria bacterium]MBT7348174.1 thymidine phosphorylase [Candidatus Falkowbacteria bacterium]MBT7500589.1 thymidine phosphorylase [Candidatus Falkowbacteria bacterium]
MVYLKGKNLDIETGAGLIALMNEEEANNFGIHVGDKISLVWKKGKKVTVTVDMTNKLVKPGEIGLFEDVWKKKQVPDGSIVKIIVESRPLSIETLKKKMLGQPATYKELYSLIKDIADGKLGQIETTYYAATSFIKEYSTQELYYVAKAMAETGEKFNLSRQVADKHSVGGLAGNRMTPIIVPIVASLGINIPKTSSRAITSPAGTADTMEVLCNVSFPLNEIKKIVKKTKGCLVWGGGLRMAPADDKIIKVSRPLALEPYDKMIVSIMAKKVATGVDYLVLDIPVGPTCKVPNMKHANEIESKFKSLCKKFGMKIIVVKTPAKQPVGRGIGPALEARDILRIMQLHKFRPLDLENKSCKLTGALLELMKYCPKGKGYAIAKAQIKNGQAWKKLNQIIVAQGGEDNLNSEEVMQEVLRHEFQTKKAGKIKSINNRAINRICMNLGAPIDKYAGIHTHVNYGEKVKKGQKLYTMYASNKERLKLGVLASNNKVIYEI